MGEKVEKISGSYFRGFTVGNSSVLPVLRRRIDGLNTPATVNTAGAETYTAAQISRGIILRDPNGASRTDTLPTAAFIIAGVGNQYTLAENGDTIVFEVQNTAAATHNVTLAAGAGVTLLGDIVIPPLGSRILTAIRTGASAVQVTAVNPLAAPGVTNATATTITANSAQTYTAAQLLGGYIARDPNGAPRTDLTATAAQLNTAAPSLAIGSSFDVILKNTADAAETITLNGGANVTLIGAIAVAQNETAVLRFVKTAAAAFDVVKLG
jgi:hypothetical protein